MDATEDHEGMPPDEMATVVQVAARLFAQGLAAGMYANSEHGIRQAARDAISHALLFSHELHLTFAGGPDCIHSFEEGPAP